MKIQKRETIPEIIEKNNQLWTTSLEIAEKFGKRHENVIRAIENLDIPESFYLLNFESIIRDYKGGKQKYYLISRNGFSLVVMGFTGKKATLWKINFINAFVLMEKSLIRLAHQIKRRGELEWQEARRKGITIRINETDVIKRFVEYATAQGSKNANKYYITITKMQNQALFFLDKAIKPDNLRNYLDVMDLIHLAVADNIVRKVLEEEMAKGTFYKGPGGVYEIAKNKVIAFAETVGRSRPLLTNQD